MPPKTQLDPEMIKAFLEQNPQFNPYTKPGRKVGGKNKKLELKEEMEVPITTLEEKGITLTAKQAEALLKKPRKKPELSEEEKDRRRAILAKGREVLAQKKALKKQELEALKEVALAKQKTIPLRVKARKQKVVKEVPIVSTSDEEEDTLEDTTTDEETTRVKRKLEKRKKIIEEIDQKLSTPPPSIPKNKFQLALASRGWNL